MLRILIMSLLPLAGVVIAQDPVGLSRQQVDRLMQNPQFQQDVAVQKALVREVEPSTQTVNLEALVHEQASQQQSSISQRLSDYVREGELAKAHMREQGSVLVFVSLSLPDDLLQQYFAEAQQLGATVVFRGFKNNDYLAMKQALDSRGLHGPYQIDPITTKKYGITAVPAFLLLLRPEQPCQGEKCPLAAHIKAEGVSSIRDFLVLARGHGEETDKVVRQWLNE